MIQFDIAKIVWGGIGWRTELKLYLLNGFGGSFALSYRFTPLWKVSASLLNVGTTLLSQTHLSCLNKIYMEDEEEEYMQQEEEGKGFP